MTPETGKERTVIVVGAGASHEFGLPVGSELQDQIAEVARYDLQGGGSRTIKNGLAKLPSVVGLESFTYQDEARLKAKASNLAFGVQHAASIDNFLHANQSDKELVAIGKFTIAGCILAAEAQSSLAYRERRGFRGEIRKRGITAPHQSWIGILVKLLTSGKDFTDFCEALNTISFVCFNYDRCIERYVFEAAALIYPAEEYDVEKLSAALSITHPYGYLGELRPQDGLHGTFGKVDDQRLLAQASKSIRTFTEGMESDVRQKIAASFAAAKNVIFLGYGFIDVNDEFLFDSAPFQMGRVLGTTFRISPERTEAISEKLQYSCLMKRTPHDGWQRLSSVPQLRAESCSDLLGRFSHVIEKIGK